MKNDDEKRGKKTYEAGQVTNGFAKALKLFVGFGIFLVCIVVIVLTIYLTVKGGLWIWGK